jgi:hypothetical protein
MLVVDEGQIATSRINNQMIISVDVSYISHESKRLIAYIIYRYIALDIYQFVRYGILSYILN